MTLQEFGEYCMGLPGASRDLPFDDVTEVFRRGRKIFALCAKDQSGPTFWVNLKCDPDLAADLRRAHVGVKPGWHMNKRHWNSVTINADVPDETVVFLINHSYDLVKP